MMLKKSSMMQNSSLRRKTLVGGAVALAAPVLVFGGSVLADTTPVIVFQHSGCEAMMPSEKDAGLRRAVGMLSERLAEIPGEIQRASGDPNMGQVSFIADRILPLLTATFEYPGEFAILDNGINDLGVPDIDVRMVYETGDRAEAEKLHTAINTIFSMAMPNAPLQAADSNADFLQLQTPFATLLFGPDGDAGRFAIGIDLGGDGILMDRIALSAPAELGGITPIYQLHVNGQGILNLVDFASNMIPDPMVRQQLEAFMAQMPEESITLDAAGGFRDGRGISITKLTNFKALMNMFAAQMPQGVPEIGFISSDLLKSVPADARLMTAANQDLGMIVNSMIEQVAAQSGGAFNPLMMLDEVEMQIGVHPINDLVNHLGANWVSYTSDSTGGGGLLSMVFLNSGANGGALAETFDKLSGTANAIASMQTMGYVRCQSWGDDQAGQAGMIGGYTLTFPGLPIPLELSMGVTEHGLVAGLSRQAVQAAALQATGGALGSIFDNPRFAEVIQGELESVNKMAFIDTAASINRGYPMAQLVGAAVANFVRSPIDPTRDPGMVVPTYNVLTAGAHGMVQVSYLDGDDAVQYTSSDASWFVNIAGLSGSLGITPEVIGAGALGAAIGANAK